MRVHGGQYIHINIEKGSILLFHAIAKDFNEKPICDLVDWNYKLKGVLLPGAPDFSFFNSIN